MKITWLTFLLLLHLHLLTAQQDVSLPGQVVEQNSKYRTGSVKYISNAEVKSAGAAPQRSDAQGKFTLVFADRSGGDVARIVAAKNGYEVVNEEELKHASVIGRKQPLKIVMCIKGQLYANQIAYYNIASDASLDAYKRKVAILQKEGKEKERLMAELRTQFSQDIKTKEEAVALLDNQRQQAEQQAKELADKWITINLDDESPAYQRAFAAFEAKNVELAKAILDSVDLEKRLALNSREKTKEEALRDTLQKSIQKREEEIRKDVNMCLFKAGLHELDLEWDKAGIFYDLIIKYNSDDVEALFDAALFMQSQHQYDKALKCYENILVVFRQLSEKDPNVYMPDVATTLNNIGNLFSDKNEMSNARHAYEEALRIRRILCEKNPDVYLPDVAHALNSWGLFLSRNNDMIDAKKAYEEAILINTLLSDKQPDVYLPFLATNLNNLANLLFAQNDIITAKKNYEKALQINRDFGQKEPDLYLPVIGTSLINLGLLLESQKENHNASQLFEEALQIYRQLVKKNPDKYMPVLAMSLNVFGNFLQRQNEMSAARQSFEEALSINRKLAGNDPDVYLPAVAETLNNLGLLSHNQNDIIAAKQAFEEELLIYRRLADKNPDVYLLTLASGLNNIGNLLRDENELNSAKLAYEEALSINRRLSEKNPDIYLPEVAMILNNLGNLLHDQNEMNTAKQAFEEALLIYRKVAEKNPGEHKLSVAANLINLGNLLYDLNELDSAKKAFDESLQIYRQFSETNQDECLPHMVTVLDHLGNLLLINNEIIDAKQAFDEALQIRRQLAGKYPDEYLPELSATLNNYGNWLMTINDLSGAKKAFLESLQIYQQLAENEPDPFNLGVCGADINLGLLDEQLLIATRNMSLTKEGLELMQDAEERLAIFPDEHPQVQEYWPYIERLTYFFNNFNQDTFQLDQQLIDYDPSAEQSKTENDPHQNVLQQEELIRILLESEKAIPDSEMIKNVIASNYGTLAWYQLLDKQFTAAERSARAGLEKDPDEEWINTNLALALLYQGKWEEALPVYKRLKDKPYDKGTYRDTFLEDLNLLEKEGITHPDVMKARELLKNK